MIQTRHRALVPARRFLPCLILTVALCLPSWDAAADTFEFSERPASGDELLQFQSWFSAAHPGLRAPVPLLQLRRVDAKNPWRIWAAAADSLPRRGVRALCILNRARFTLDGAWKEEGEPRQFAWLEAKGCTSPGMGVEIAKRMPESDIVELLEQQARLLASARLLFSGNSGCARQRSFRYQLHAIDLGSVIPGGEEMAALVYHDDRGGMAKVWARRSGIEHTAWNVNCGPLVATVSPQLVRPR